MNHIQQMATLKALEMARIYRGSDGMEHVVQQAGGEPEKMGLKRVQFETFPAVFDLLDATCSKLGVSKREFMEGAMLDAISQAEQVFGETFKDVMGYEFPQDQEAA